MLRFVLVFAFHVPAVTFHVFRPWPANQDAFVVDAVTLPACYYSVF